jgi:hypothetical protein
MLLARVIGALDDRPAARQAVQRFPGMAPDFSAIEGFRANNLR